MLLRWLVESFPRPVGHAGDGPVFVALPRLIAGSMLLLLLCGRPQVDG